jgi:hypothetical protein
MLNISSGWSEPRNFDIYISHNGGWGQSYEMKCYGQKDATQTFSWTKICAKQDLKGQLHDIGFENTDLNTYTKHFLDVVYWSLFRTFYHNVYRFLPFRFYVVSTT